MLRAAMLLDLGSQPEHHAHYYAVDRYIGSMLMQYGTGHGIPLCHGCPLWDNRAVRIRCRWCRASFHFLFVLLLLNKHLQVFHSSVSCAMLLCRGLLCAVPFPRYFFCVYLYVFLQCSSLSSCNAPVLDLKGVRLPLLFVGCMCACVCVCVFTSLSTFVT